MGKRLSLPVLIACILTVSGLRIFAQQDIIEKIKLYLKTQDAQEKQNLKELITKRSYNVIRSLIDQLRNPNRTLSILDITTLRYQSFGESWLTNEIIRGSGWISQVT
jgi:hypothetical protein